MKIENRETTMRAIYEDEWWAIQEMRKFGPVVNYRVFKMNSSLTPYGEVRRIETSFTAIPEGQDVLMRIDIKENV